MTRLPSLLFALAAALAATPAAAEIWRVAPEESAIRFEYTEDGEAKSGAFGRFSGRGVFDQRYPDRATLILEIQVGSIELEDRFRTNFVQGDVWFNASAFPEVRYELRSLEQQGDVDYLATGVLTIKGVSETVTTPITITFDEAGGRARARTRFEFNRFDFNVGDSGLWIDIGQDVAVDVDLVATGR